MFKRRAAFLAISATLILTALTAVSAKGLVPLEVVATRQTGDGLDRLFEFDVSNSTARDLFARGRVVFLNVYDASLPTAVPVPDTRVPAGGTATVGVRWADAPLAGEVRALLVLNDGQDPSLIESFVFWVFPVEQAALFVGLAALAAAIALAVIRLPKRLKSRTPSGMLSYEVEDDDTVVTLSTRYDVTWQDIVRANRLKPPYALRIGQRILIPKHGLRKPEPKP